MRENYELLSSQTEYYQSSLLGRSNMYALSLIVIFDIEKTDEELFKVAQSFGKNHDVTYLNFTKDGKQYFLDLEEGNARIDENISEVYHVDSKDDVLSFAKNILNAETIDIFDRTFHFELLRGEEFSAFVVSGHHTMYDGFCIPLILDELSFLMGLTDNIPEYGSYEEHIKEELEFKNTKRFEKDKQFWNKTLTPEISYSLFDSFENEDFSSEESRFFFDSDEASRIRKFADDNDIQLSSLIYAITATFLNRVTGKKKFTLGTPVLNRLSEEDFKTMGLYLHTLPLVCEVEDKTFISVCEHFEDSTIDLLRHQKFTQYDIKKECEIGERDLFDTVCDYQGYFNNTNAIYDVAFPNTLSVNYEIHFKETKDGRIEVITRFRDSVFKRSSIDNMEKALYNMTLKLIEEPHILVSELKLYDNPYVLYGEKKDIPNKTLFEIFMDTARANPNNIAIELDNSSYTYLDLFNYSKAIGEKLRDELKKPVAIIAERSIEMFAGIYGIQYMGLPYLPLLPEWPKKRITDVLKDSGVKYIICQDKYFDMANSLNLGLTVLNISDELTRADIQNTEIKSDVAYSLDDIAYVIYTSGSTGKAKGVMVSQKSIVNRINWMNDEYELGLSDSILQKTPYSFDVSVWELFWWAFTGAKLSVIEPEMHFDPDKIIQSIKNHKVTHIHFVPSVFRLFVSYLKRNMDRAGDIAYLKHVFLSGEKAEIEYCNMFFDMLPTVRVHNLYGPTECAVDVTYHEIHKGDSEVIPIGKPVYNTEIYIQDSFLNKLPKGMTGEIVICGANVGEGYINNKKMSEMLFSFDKELDEKIYFSGDYGYIDDNDEVIYIGRKDSQLKINGQRVDLKEVENAMKDIDGIKEFAVIIERLHNKNSIVLFYVLDGESQENGNVHCVKNGEDIKARLSDKLPLYMVPSYILEVSSLPIGYSGKLDRSKLRDEILLHLNSKVEEGEEPVGALETEISGLFREILGIDNVNRDTDFLKYKSSSLDIVSLLASSEIFNRLTGKDVMLNPTPRLLAKLIDGKLEESIDFIGEEGTSHSLNNDVYEKNEGSDNPNKEQGLTLLYKGTKDDDAIVIFPFAAGKEESFATLLRAINKLRPECSVYFKGFDVIFDNELDDVSGEIIELSKKSKVTFYSHCAGSAIAESLIFKIREMTRGKEADVVSSHIIAASVPSITKDGVSPWRRYPMFVTKSFLKMAGAKKDVFNPDTLEIFKKESDLFFDICKEDNLIKNGTHKVPTKVILWEKDVFTGNYKRARELWSRFSSEVRDINFIETNNHYFQASNADEIAKYIIWG